MITMITFLAYEITSTFVDALDMPEWLYNFYDKVGDFWCGLLF